ncbi:MAG: hypothetical protein OSJ27_01095 [Candidatus Gastranaerophilales bacterium]|nr:hypothetical protein [Candidatus Gastranaerophilales bacterium]
MDENKKETETMETTDIKKPENPNKITAFEIFILFLIILCIGLYISPNFLVKLENRKYAQIQTNAGIFTSKALSEFSSNPKMKASVISKKLTEELNAVNKNPLSKKEPAYITGEKCEGCVIITPDDKLNSITVEAYSKENALLVRTVIQPPSFVTYTRDLTVPDKKDKKDKKKEAEKDAK